MPAQSTDSLMELAMQSHRDGDTARAESIYRQIIGLDSRHAAAHHGLGIALFQQQRAGEAIASLRRAVQFNPNEADYHANLGVVLAATGDHNQAIACFNSAIAVDPEHVEAYFNRGGSLGKTGRLNQAIASFEQAIALYPDFPEALTALGESLLKIGNPQAAVPPLRRAADLISPPSALARSNLAHALFAAGETEEAVAVLREATRLDPSCASAWHNLGNALKEFADLPGAIACYERAAALDPDYGPTHSNRLLALHFDPRFDSKSICAEHVRWRQEQVDPLRLSPPSHINDRSRDRALRIGYVSPDFRAHVVGWNLLPLMRHHNHQDFRVYCYSDVVAPDAITAELRARADVWRETTGVSDEQLAALIRSDQIDILIDLSLHTNGNRLLVFARKPAPIQVTWLGYCSTTGLDSIDYRISDPHMDPPTDDQLPYTEQTIRLPKTFWCYQPGGPTPDPLPAPADSCGFITFGCLNNFAKVSPRALDAWTQIMRQIPGSRLLLHTPAGPHRQALGQFLWINSIESDRVELVPRLPWADYIKLYRRIDIALDPFPFGGGITTCDALWMGVPLITLAGQTAVGRGGKSILNNLGLPDLAADGVADYIQTAVKLAKDPSRRRELRAGLRQRMIHSPLMDAAAFAIEMEKICRMVWTQWASKATSPLDASR